MKNQDNIYTHIYKIIHKIMYDKKKIWNVYFGFGDEGMGEDQYN